MTSYLVNARTSSRKSNRIVPGLVMALLLPGCAAVDIYNMQGMEGTVVDKATGEPIEGVMVIEVWEAGGGFEGHTVDYLPLQEAVTDRNGRYEFPARGTKHVEEGFLTADSPRLIFFRPGYIFKSESNRYHPDRRFEFNRRSDWHRKTV
ncbi:MAG TPA: carboxypeptidase regulatory-like domain-containing protein, partial [Gammaproteobacteria bacterium]|nr:carboxypeptidase regulatory-like domain-containing protein [Gammaproteobacteria bacterium]